MVVQRCSKCAAITTEFALSEEFRKAKITHHANFSALEQSAASGCDLCRLLRQYLLHDVSIAKPEDTDDPITISHFESDELFLYMSGMGCFLTLERVPQLSDTKPLHRKSDCFHLLAVAKLPLLRFSRIYRRKLRIRR